MFSERSPARRVRGRLVGVFFGNSFVASLAGLVIGGYAHWRWLFFVPAALGGLLTLCLIFCRSDILRSKHIGEINYIKVFQHIQIRNVFLFIFAISFLYHGVHKWYGVYLSRVYHMDSVSISWFFIITVVAGLIGQLLGVSYPI